MRFINVANSIAVATALLAVVFGYLANFYMAMIAPLSVEYEGPCFWASWMIAQGKNPYDAAALTSTPIGILIYPPCYFVISGLLLKLTGAVYWPLRLVSELSIILSAIALYRLFAMAKCTKLSIAIGLIIYLTYFPIWSWAYKGRVDMLSIAFSAWALERFVHAWLAKDNGGANGETVGGGEAGKIAALMRRSAQYLPFILLAALATFTKQPSSVIFLAVVIFLFAVRQARLALAIVLASAIALSGALGITQILTSGGYLAHMSFASACPVALDKMIRVISSLQLAPFNLFVFALALIVVLLARKRLEKPLDVNVFLPALLFVLSSTIGVYTSGLKFSNPNHLMLPLLSLSWLTGVLVDRISFTWFKTIASTSVVLGASLFLFLVGRQSVPAIDEQLPLMSETFTQLRQLNLKDKLVLAEDPAVCVMVGAVPDCMDIVGLISLWENPRIKSRLPD
ncbi:MAG TPA: hypothetical protein V6D17_11315, partial [Candidatus Obscuribacterales bacterium]